MAKISTYSFGNVASILDGVPILGFFEGDDVVVVAPIENQSELMVGTDGSSILSQMVGNPHTITLRLQHTSPAHTRLKQKMARQRVKPAPFSFSVNDIANSEGQIAESCFIQQTPSASNGKNATVREWVLVTPNVRDI